MAMERSKESSLLMCLLFAALLSQNLVIPVMSASLGDQKNYYPPDPHQSPPRGSYDGPPISPPPGGYGGSPPSHNPPPHGSGGSCPTPSKPPSHKQPPTPSTPTPTPSTPTPTPTTPTPTTPTPTAPTPSGGGYYHSPPPTPTYDPGTPSTPTPSVPSPPFVPNTPPFTCNYWRTHPGLIWGLLGWWGTVGAFGLPSISGFGASTSLQQALSNTRTDGLGALYREGTASLLNSMAHSSFPYTTKQVRDNFVTAALGSNKAAAAQAQLFKLANEGHLKPKA